MRVAGLALVLALSGPASIAGQASPAADGFRLVPANLPSRAEVLRWHRAKAANGPTYSGSPGWRRFLEGLERELATQGVVGLERNRWTYQRWHTSDRPESGDWTLAIGGKPVRLTGYGAYSGSTGPVGLTAKLVRYDPGAPREAMRGNIVVFEAPSHPAAPYDERYRTWFTVNDYEFASDSASFPPRFTRVSPSATVTFDTWWQLRGMSVSIYDSLAAWGAAGAVGVYAMSRERARGLYSFPVQTLHRIPVVYTDRTEGARVLEEAARGASASLKLRAALEPTETYQLIGYLPGRDYGTPADRQILLITHTDGPSISQDNGALGLLGVVAYFARLPRAKRARTLTVFLDNRHYMPGMEPAFAAEDWFSKHPEARSRIAGLIVMEHLGEREYREAGDRVISTGRPEITFLWSRADSTAVARAVRAVRENRLPRTLVQAVERSGIHGGTQGVWYGMGAIALEWNLPAYAMLGYLGGYWTTRAGLSRFDPDLFLAQVATMTQLTGDLMNPPSSRSSPIAITHANVLPMDRDTVLLDHTVVVRGDRIERIGPAVSVPIPAGAAVVDATGKYLMPGLADMHVHTETAAFAQAFKAELKAPIPFERVLFPYLATGVTTVRVLSGAPDLLQVRDSIRRGLLLGPRMLVASPMLDGDPPVLPEPFTRALSTPAEARQAVAEYASAGYDLVKVRDRLSAEVYRAILEEAKRVGLEVDGHLPRKAGLTAEAALSSGQAGLAHLEVLGYFEGLGDELIPKYTRLVKDNGLHVTTTLVVFPNILGQAEHLDSLLELKEMRYVHPLFRTLFWEPPRNPYQGKYDADGLAHLRKFWAFLAKLTRSLQDAEVPLLAGSDALNPMLVPGYSLQDELGYLVGAGLTPFEALRTATVNPARVIKGLGDGGSVAPGKRADLLLLEADPRAAIGNVRRIAGVAVAGRWLSAAEIAGRLAAVSRGY
jgi:imidazolonepropionase-like amidohydrolase